VRGRRGQHHVLHQRRHALAWGKVARVAIGL
jgi:hypothetical protein